MMSSSTSWVSMIPLSVVVGQDPPPPTCEDMLQSRLDCYDTDGPCDPLPIPSTAFGDLQPDPTKGYFIGELRENVYYVGEGAYLAMVMLVPPPMTSRRDLTAGIPLNPNIKKHCSPDDLCDQCEGDCQNDKDCKGNLVCYQKNKKTTTVPGCAGTTTSKTDWCVDPNDIPSKDGGEGYQLVVIDMPTGSFDVYNENGQVVTSLMTNVIDDIVMDMHGLDPEGT